MASHTQGGPPLGSSQYDPSGRRPEAVSPASDVNRWVWALAILDVILLVVLVALAVTFADDNTRPNDAQQSSAAQVPGSSKDDLDSVQDLDPSMTGAQTFSTPTGNIVCTISSQGVRCSIARLAKDPKPNVGECTGYVGYVAELRSTGPTLPCVATEDLPGGANDSLPVLEYGKKQTVNNYECESLRTGMKCYDINNNRGFNVARAGITTF